MNDDAADSNLVRPFIGDKDRISGAFDYIDPRYGLRGWLVQPSRDTAPLRVEAWCNGYKLAETVTVLDRPGVDNILKRKTNCGFLIGWSRFDRAALTRFAKDTPDSEIVVRVGGTEMDVPATGVSLTAREALRMLLGAPRGDRGAEFAILNDYVEVEASGLFDADWYCRQYGAEIAGKGLPLLHYLTVGEAEGKRPNLYFDPVAYSQSAFLLPEEAKLLHYLRREHGTRIAPSVHFDNAWYRAKYRLDTSVSALAHYLGNRAKACPNGLVTAKMLRQKPVGEPSTDPYEAYLRAKALKTDAFGNDPKISDEMAEVLSDALALFASLPSTAPVAQEGLAGAEPDNAKDESLALLQQTSTLNALIALAASDKAAAVLASAEANSVANGGAPSLLATLLRSALAAQAGRIGEAAEGLSGCIAGLVADEVKEAGQDMRPLLKSVLSWGHEHWRGLRTPEILKLFQALRAVEIHDRMSIIRILEATVDSRDILASANAAEDLGRLYPDAATGWVLIALARFHMLQGDSDEAAASLRRIPPPPESDEILFSNAIILLIEAGDFAEAKTRLALLANSTSKELQIARVRLAVRTKDWVGLSMALQNAEPGALPVWVLCESAYLTVEPGKVAGEGQPAAEALIVQALDLLSGTSEDALLAEMHVLIQRRRFADLGALFDKIDGATLAETTAVMIRKLEFLCLSERISDALELYHGKLAGTVFGKWEGMSVIRLLSEAKQWEEAGNLTLSHITQGFGFGTAVHTAMRVVRKARLHDKIAELVAEGRISSVREPELSTFLAMVQEDHTLVQSARAITGQGAFTPASLNRLGNNWMLATPHMRDDEKDCMFLCTNRRYFLSLLTFLCSYFGQTHQANAVIFVFLDRDVRRSWHSAITLLAARFNRTVEIVTEEEFMPNGVDHKADYGFFAGGGLLSRAAYFRLYAARYLMAKNRFTRSLYADTDIVCRGDLTGLLEIDLNGAALAARIEDYGQEVKEAAESNGLDPFRYFNSGVLVFDFAHPGLKDLLERAIHLSEHEPDRLMFHDQCALNIAFVGSFRELPAAYNFFLRPHRERNGYIEDGILLHYLDKPKPWDIVFSRNYREEWRVWAVQLSMIIPQTLYVDIFAAANEE